MLLGYILNPRNLHLNPRVNVRNKAEIAWEMTKFLKSLGYGLLICLFPKGSQLKAA
jgi:hypothetical protein